MIGFGSLYSGSKATFLKLTDAIKLDKTDGKTGYIIVLHEKHSALPVIEELQIPNVYMATALS